jgi:hypothetical protein
MFGFIAPYIHNSGLQAITVLSLLHTLYIFFYWCMHPAALCLASNNLPSTQQFFSFIHSLHVSTTKGHLQVFNY